MDFHIHINGIIICHSVYARQVRYFVLEIKMTAVLSREFRFIEFPLTRIRTTNKSITPFSMDLSCRGLELQIELRAKLLKDIQLVRSRLRGQTGDDYVAWDGNYSGGQRRQLVGRVGAPQAKVKALARSKSRGARSIPSS